MSKVDTLDVVKDCGAIPGTDCTVAFQAAIAGAYTVHVPYHPAGYIISSPLILAEPISIIGNWLEPVIHAGCMIFDIRSSKVKIENFHLNLPTSPDGTPAILINTVAAPTTLNFIDIIHLDISGAYHAIIDNGGAGIYVNLHIKQVNCWGGRNVQIDLYRSIAYLIVEDVATDQVGHFGFCADFPQIRVTGNEGASFHRVNVAGNAIIGTGSGHGFQFDNCKALHLTDCMADNLAGWGFVFNECEYLYLSGVIASLCTHGSMNFLSCNYLQSVNVIVGGRKDIPGALTGIIGLQYKLCSNIRTFGLSTRNNTGVPLRVFNSINGAIRDTEMVNNGAAYTNNSPTVAIT